MLKTPKTNRFNIDFFEFVFLVETCIPPSPIARSMFWSKVIDKHYDILTNDERNQLYEWINLNPGFQFSLEKNNEDCLLFVARYNPNNQYLITTIYDNKEETRACFFWRDKYYINSTTSIIDDYITKSEKIPITDDY